MKKNRRSRRGFTLAETMIALLVVSLVSMTVAVGVAASGRVYHQAVTVSESQLLASTLTAAIENELRYASDIQGVASPTFYSEKYGSGVSFGTDEGQITLGGYKLIGSGAYSTNTNQTKSADIQVSWNGTQFEVCLTIFKGQQQLQQVEMSVTPLNYI